MQLQLPMVAMTLLPADEYEFRVEALRDRLVPIEGVGDEALMAFVGDPDTAAADLAELGSLIFDRL
ncbi:MAG: hypothetical protein JJE52_01940 [Acidimicrobiia bacterium]|nr:hypothetical protein [Acidimicrobiia bacterium]